MTDHSARESALLDLIERIGDELAKHFDVERRNDRNLREIWARRRGVLVEVSMRAPAGLSITACARGRRLPSRFSEAAIRWSDEAGHFEGLGGESDRDAVLKLVGDAYREARRG